MEAAGRRRNEAREVAAEDDAAALFFLDARGAGDAAAADLLDVAREYAFGREAHRVDADGRGREGEGEDELRHDYSWPAAVRSYQEGWSSARAKLATAVDRTKIVKFREMADTGRRASAMTLRAYLREGGRCEGL